MAWTAPKGFRTCSVEKPARPGSVTAIALAAFLAAPMMSPAASQELSKKSLGGYPLCEASAALAADCPEAKGETCLLVADNEIRDKLFLFSVDGKDGRLSERREVPINTKKKDRVSDIEAMALLNSGEILVYGSHSRNRRCELKTKRQRILSGKLEPAGFDARRVSEARSRKMTCNRLFGVKRGKAAGNMKMLCDALHVAEQDADKAAKLGKEAAARACNEIDDFNLEGAVVLGGKSQDIWVGLRAPLANAEGDAFLMRQTSPNGFAFDAVVRLDLDKAGIREIAADKTHVWIISGPSNDGGEKHSLWRFPKKRLAAKSVSDGELRIRPKRLSVDLPTSAEGLVVTAGKAYVLMDGAEPKGSSSSCNRNSVYNVYSLKQF
ncbi:hypothetical protein [Hoeflea prorocentri]|uniref:DUF3616 domain-containing protein n=1 Tax=Hoeflea prorocentri TaxID=1922333 RepID=A0A9X3ZIK4_9HYPH|nr:hypothetical protein [Hoeflea prorocentri]MCY6381931.1 hypothetical protein [Hoeflea prorocentri]MDA5399731.1 hypothetical protein [Hoeflea prorocentri]